MRVELSIDGYTKAIDTVNPELLARWLLEQFAIIQWTPATYCRVQAWPSFNPYPGRPAEPGEQQADWICDTRYLGGITEIRSPRDFLAQLTAQLNEYEHDRAASPLDRRQGTESRKAAEDYTGQTARQVNGPSTY